MSLFPKRVHICEVGPRDGLQNESQWISTDIKLEFIERLIAAGLTDVEVTSFVSPKRVPQMEDHEALYRGLKLHPGIRYPVLVPNIQGLNEALSCGVQDIAVFGSPSEAFLQHNIHCTVDESLKRYEEVITQAKKNHLRVRGYVSCVLGCPYEGQIPFERVVEYTQKLWAMGCDEISLGDTIGVGTPHQAQALIEKIVRITPREHIAVHFHDTYGQALANIYACLELGIERIDASVAGLGGCPYAQGASGNVATEDVIYMLNGLKIETGVDLERLIQAAYFISKHLKMLPRSKVARALGQRN